MNPNGKIAILTGASSGIGLELLKLLSKYDTEIIAVSRHKENIPDYGERIHPYACDISIQKEVDDLFSSTIQKFGHIDLFIANAGFGYCEEINTANWEHIEKIYRTNVFSPIYSFEKMKELNKGKKYNFAITCSAVSRIPLAGFSLYCSTKAAIEHFAHTYYFERNDLGTLTLTFPVATSTRFFKKAGDKAPMPFPVQSSSWVARCILAGIRSNSLTVFPSLLYLFGYFVINRIFPFVFGIYDLINAARFHHWIKRRKRENF